MREGNFCVEDSCNNDARTTTAAVPPPRQRRRLALKARRAAARRQGGSVKQENEQSSECEGNVRQDSCNNQAQNNNNGIPRSRTAVRAPGSGGGGSGLRQAGERAVLRVREATATSSDSCNNAARPTTTAAPSRSTRRSPSAARPAAAVQRIGHAGERAVFRMREGNGSVADSCNNQAGNDSGARRRTAVRPSAGRPGGGSSGSVTRPRAGLRVRGERLDQLLRATTHAQHNHGSPTARTHAQHTERRANGRWTGTAQLGVGQRRTERSVVASTRRPATGARRLLQRTRSYATTTDGRPPRAASATKEFTAGHGAPSSDSLPDPTGMWRGRSERGAPVRFSVDDPQVLGQRAEDLVAVLGHHHQVLDPHAAAARQVDARLDGDDVARLERRLARCEPRAAAPRGPPARRRGPSPWPKCSPWPAASMMSRATASISRPPRPGPHRVERRRPGRAARARRPPRASSATLARRPGARAVRAVAVQRARPSRA